MTMAYINIVQVLIYCMESDLSAAIRHMLVIPDGGGGGGRERERMRERSTYPTHLWHEFQCHRFILSSSSVITTEQNE